MLQTPRAECIARYVGNMNQLEPLLLDVEHSKLRVSGHTNTPNSHTKNNLRFHSVSGTRQWYSLLLILRYLFCVPMHCSATRRPFNLYIH